MLLVLTPKMLMLLMLQANPPLTWIFTHALITPQLERQQRAAQRNGPPDHNPDPRRLIDNSGYTPFTLARSHHACAPSSAASSQTGAGSVRHAGSAASSVLRGGAIVGAGGAGGLTTTATRSRSGTGGYVTSAAGVTGNVGHVTAGVTGNVGHVAAGMGMSAGPASGGSVASPRASAVTSGTASGTAGVTVQGHAVEPGAAGAGGTLMTGTPLVSVPGAAAVVGVDPLVASAGSVAVVALGGGAGQQMTGAQVGLLLRLLDPATPLQVRRCAVCCVRTACCQCMLPVCSAASYLRPMYYLRCGGVFTEINAVLIVI